MSDQRKYVRWIDIERDAKPLFAIWNGHPELQWARAAWERLERKGLTHATDEVERTVVLVRLVALAAFFHGFAKVAWEEGEDDPRHWSRQLEIRRGRLLQWLGREFDSDFPWDDEELLESAFDQVYDAAYEQILHALVEGFDGVDGTFVSLWLARSQDWSGRSDVPSEIVNDILNTPSPQRLAAYEWLLSQVG